MVKGQGRLYLALEKFHEIPFRVAIYRNDKSTQCTEVICLIKHMTGSTRLSYVL